MGVFVDRSDTKVVQDEGWETWEEATIGKLDTAAYDRIRSKVMRITGQAGGMTKAQHTAARIPVVLEGLRGWTFTENGKPTSHDNQPIEITREAVGALKRHVSEFLYDQINEFNADWTDEEREAFFRRTEGSVSG